MPKFENVSTDLLEKAARERKKFEIAKEWYKNNASAVNDIKLHWHVAAGLTGYGVMQEEMQALVREQAQDLFRQAYERIELRARQAFAEAMATEEVGQ